MHMKHIDPRKQYIFCIDQGCSKHKHSTVPKIIECWTRPYKILSRQAVMYRLRYAYA